MPETDAPDIDFRDHFSGVAREYARFRPTYPAELFEFLATVAPGRELALDCGTGGGQAAIRLATHFTRVAATDASARQLALATPHERVDYRCESAESVSLPDHSVDLVTVAAAVHWFNLEPFYAEVRRVLRPKGAIAVWAYHMPSVTPAVDEVIEDYSTRILAADWPEGADYVLSRYRSLPFPFIEALPPPFSIELEWSLTELLGFIGSWSAAVRYRERTGRDPVDQVREWVARAFGRSRTRFVRCPLFLRVGTTG